MLRHFSQSYSKLCRRSCVSFCGYLIAFQLLGFLSSVISPPDAWYQNLQKSHLTPPSDVFPIVWPLLYVCLSTYAWLTWQKEETLFRIKCAFIIQMSLNFTWSILFFYLHALWLSLLSIACMILLTIYIIIEDQHENSSDWVLLVPYLIWISFAFHLTNVIVSLQ